MYQQPAVLQPLMGGSRSSRISAFYLMIVLGLHLLEASMRLDGNVGVIGAHLVSHLVRTLLWS